jgi:hypothetical protein
MSVTQKFSSMPYMECRIVVTFAFGFVCLSFTFLLKECFPSFTDFPPFKVVEDVQLRLKGP